MPAKLTLALLLLALPCRPQSADEPAIRRLIANYAAAVDAADPALAAQIWDRSAEVSFIFPGGELHGWDAVRRFYSDVMGGAYSARQLKPRGIRVRVYGGAAWSEFAWHFTATQRRDGARVETDGRETQIYRRAGGRWLLVHVHYSEMPPPR